MNKQWNVVAALSVVLVVAYTAVYGWATIAGDIDVAAFREGVLPLVTAVLGYLASMLKKDGA